MLRLCRVPRSLAALLLATALLGTGPYAGADETCNSPYMGNLIKGQEDYVYVWTLGVQGLGDRYCFVSNVPTAPPTSRYCCSTTPRRKKDCGESHLTPAPAR